MLSGSCHCGSLRWTFAGDPGSVTACNCTICRRYGALWIYGWEHEGVTTDGQSSVYSRGTFIGFHFCPACGCLAFYRALNPNEDGRRKVAANLRMVDDPGAVATLPINHFDGLDRFDDLPRDGRCVADMWF
ncbi:MAG: GFA family protein [Pseudomonadota bacterium]